MAVGDIVLSGTFTSHTSWQTTGSDFYLAVVSSATDGTFETSNDGSTTLSAIELLSQPYVTYVPTAYWRINRSGETFDVAVRSIPSAAHTTITVA